MKTQEKKQKAIELAYGSLYEKYKQSINSDGYVRFGGKSSEEYLELISNDNFEEKEWIGYSFLRPKSLSGIEDNNGWISINSEEDLPKDKINHDVFRNGKETTAIYAGSNRWFVPENDFPKETKNSGITHYFPKTEKKAPIY